MWERIINQLPLRHPPTGDQALNSVMCPDWKSNLWPCPAQTTEPRPSGPRRGISEECFPPCRMVGLLAAAVLKDYSRRCLICAWAQNPTGLGVSPLRTLSEDLPPRKFSVRPVSFWQQFIFGFISNKFAFCSDNIKLYYFPTLLYFILFQDFLFFISSKQNKSIWLKGLRISQLSNKG